MSAIRRFRSTDKQHPPPIIDRHHNDIRFSGRPSAISTIQKLTFFCKTKGKSTNLVAGILPWFVHFLFLQILVIFDPPQTGLWISPLLDLFHLQYDGLPPSRAATSSKWTHLFSFKDRTGTWNGGKKTRLERRHNEWTGATRCSHQVSANQLSRFLLAPFCTNRLPCHCHSALAPDCPLPTAPQHHWHHWREKLLLHRCLNPCMGHHSQPLTPNKHWPVCLSGWERDHQKAANHHSTTHPRLLPRQSPRLSPSFEIQSFPHTGWICHYTTTKERRRLHSRYLFLPSTATVTTHTHGHQFSCRHCVAAQH